MCISKRLEKLDFQVSGCRALTTQPEKALQFQFSMFQLKTIIMLTSHLNLSWNFNNSLDIGSCHLTENFMCPSIHDFHWGHSAGHPTDTEPSDTRWRHGFQHRAVLVKLMDKILALAKAYWKWTSQKFLFCRGVLLSSVCWIDFRFGFPTSMWTHARILSCMLSQTSLRIKPLLVVCPLKLRSFHDFPTFGAAIVGEAIRLRPMEMAVELSNALTRQHKWYGTQQIQHISHSTLRSMIELQLMLHPFA